MLHRLRLRALRSSICSLLFESKSPGQARYIWQVIRQDSVLYRCLPISHLAPSIVLIPTCSFKPEHQQFSDHLTKDA